MQAHPIYLLDRGRDQERARLINNNTPTSLILASGDNSTHSTTAPNTPIAATFNSASAAASTMDLERPLPPFMGIASGSRTYTNNSSTALASGRSSPALHSPGSEHKLAEAESSVSLSTHYLPSKFSSTMLNPAGPGPRRRKGRGKGEGEGGESHVPKMGGGVDAFRSGEARMAVDGDEDYDGVNIGGPKTEKMSWNRFKWTLFFANLVVSCFIFGFLSIVLIF